VIKKREYNARKQLRNRIVELMSILYHGESASSIRKYIEKCINEYECRRIYVLVVDRQICGVAIVNAVKRKTVSLTELVVHPRDKGYGTMFLAMLTVKFWTEGISKIVIPLVIPDEKVKNFYLKSGFKETLFGGMELKIRRPPLLNYLMTPRSSIRG